MFNSKRVTMGFMKPSEKAKKGRQTGIRDAACDVLYLLLFAMTTVLVLYRPNGYDDLGEDKFHLFRLIGVVFSLVMAVITAIFFSDSNRRTEALQGFRDTMKSDVLYRASVLFFFAVAASHVVSFLAAVDRGTALWGRAGWRTGFLSFLMMLLIFASYACCFQKRREFYVVLTTGPALAALLAVFNRFGLLTEPALPPDDPYYPFFLSTIGNINWFAGFLSVFLPVAFALFLTGKKRVHLVWSTLLCTVFLMASFLQGSDGILLSLAGTFAVLVLAGTANRKQWERFLYGTALTGLCMESSGLLMTYAPYNYTAESGSVLIAVCTSHAGAALFLLSAGLLLICKRRAGCAFPARRLRMAAAALILCAGVILAAICTVLLISLDHPDEVLALFPSGRLVLTDDWGSMRGGAYRLSSLLFRQMPFPRKLAGAGQDCLYACTASDPALLELSYRMFGTSALANAHSIPLTTLVNRGITGFLADAGFYLSCAVLFAKTLSKHPENTLLLAAGGALASCFLNGLLSFEHLMSTPFLLLLLGAAMAETGKTIRSKSVL